MTGTIRLTAAQALVRYLENQFISNEGTTERYFAGVWAIFGHGNVAGIGEALYGHQETLPTYRAHNEQGMAHAAIAFAKKSRRRRAMACTTSIGPGATNMVTAAALAHVNRLPVLFLPGDTFANRLPDPVLQQLECSQDGTVTANDCFRPVSAYFDRIIRPEQLLDALPRMMSIFMDPASCGPVTLAMPQDVQAEAYDFPESFFSERVWSSRRPRPDSNELKNLVSAVETAEKPLIIAGGGILYSGAEAALSDFAKQASIPVCETQAGKSSLAWDDPQNLGSIGVTGSSASNETAQEADLVIAVGTRLQDFTTGSRSLFHRDGCKIIQVNVNGFDAHKQGADTVVADAKVVLEELTSQLQAYSTPAEWQKACADRRQVWMDATDQALRLQQTETGLPSDSAVIGAAMESFSEPVNVVCAAGGLPGELHKLWRPTHPTGYHVEYGFSCMGYEIAGGLGVKMAQPDEDTLVMVGDGSYMMLNSELATSVMLGQKLIVLMLDNRGYGCINRLQNATGNPSFNNLLKDTRHTELPDIDFAAHAASMGATAEKVADLDELKDALVRAKASENSYVIVIDTDPFATTQAGGHWWDVAVPEVSNEANVDAKRQDYERQIEKRRNPTSS